MKRIKFWLCWYLLGRSPWARGRTRAVNKEDLENAIVMDRIPRHLITLSVNGRVQL